MDWALEKVLTGNGCEDAAWGDKEIGLGGAEVGEQREQREVRRVVGHDGV